ncbi:MAG TPA: lasso peptide biosynthesis B2 protein [Thermoanaerobaculia bacterium]|nr:lasso peptide biosynthesis B2 protein [Thermoanaerobaculia bacterium]
MSASSTLRRLRRLRSSEAWALVRAWWLLLWIDLGLRLLPFQRLESWLAPAPGNPRAADETVVPEMIWATAAAARHHLYPMRCLPQALCLRWLLGRRGVVTELRIGVERQGGDLRAHAWVERDGRPVGEDLRVVDRFAPLRPVS